MFNRLEESDAVAPVEEMTGARRASGLFRLKECPSHFREHSCLGPLGVICVHSQRLEIGSGYRR